MRVLITGGAGFIGSHLSDTLVSNGKKVTILDNLSTGSTNNIALLKDKIRVVKGDIRDKKLVENLVADSDLILHMAASLGVFNILDNPIESISTNFHGSEIVLNAAHKFDKRIIIASTSEIYGKNNNQPLTETDDRVVGSPQKLRWTYSDSKALEEAIAYYLFVSRGLRVTTVRLFNTVGPRQSAEYGMVLPRFIKSALDDKPLTIFGNGNQTRVFCHVSDAIDAILKLSIEDRSIGEVFNIGGNEEISIKELAHLVITQLKSKSEVTYLEYGQAYKPGFEETLRRVPDTSKIKKFIDWEPKINIKSIIADIAKSLV
jgi:UDP-glucose 4-epimerase